MEYLDFDIAIMRVDKGYRVMLQNSPAGQANGEFVMPFTDQEVDRFLFDMGIHRRMRRVARPYRPAAIEFGSRLYNAILPGEIRECFRSSVDKAVGLQCGLRIRLHLASVPEIADLPWELLYRQSVNRFVDAVRGYSDCALFGTFRDRTSFSRHAATASSCNAVESERGRGAGCDKEFLKLKESLSDLEKRGLVVLEQLSSATLPALQKQLRKAEYHVFHFVGHSELDLRHEEGVLLFETPDKRPDLVTAFSLAAVLHNSRNHSLRLVVLNSCEGARTSRTDYFSGIAQTILQQGIPAAIAMQFEISDAAAVVFAHEFYSALADNDAIDAALTHARVRVCNRNPGNGMGNPSPLYESRRLSLVRYCGDTAAIECAGKDAGASFNRVPCTDECCAS